MLRRDNSPLRPTVNTVANEMANDIAMLSSLLMVHIQYIFIYPLSMILLRSTTEVSSLCQRFCFPHAVVHLIIFLLSLVVLIEANHAAEAVFDDVLGRKDRADATRNALGVLNRFKLLFYLPSTIEKNIQKVRQMQAWAHCLHFQLQALNV